MVSYRLSRPKGVSRLKNTTAAIGRPETVAVDPITLEVIQQSLHAIAQEMFAAMRKTAMSSVIYEVLDFGVAITDAEGNLASSGAGIPSFVGMLDPGVKAVIRKFGLANVKEGDIFVSNDPFEGGVSHTNDVVLVMPVFHDGVLVAWTANKGHWMDIGGMVPGGNSPNATEIFQEGLLLPEIRVFQNHRPIEAILDIIAQNSRMPKQALGDLWAGISALRMGEKRIRHICSRYGCDVFLTAVTDYLDWGEKRVLRALKDLPFGTYSSDDLMDDGRSLCAKVTISADSFLVDLRGNPGQDLGPQNSSYYATLVGVQAMFKSLVLPSGAANAGTFRPLELICDEGSMFAAKRPAAVGLYYENKIRASDLIWKAVAPVLESGDAAGHFCSICATMIGVEDDDGNQFSFIEPEVGGWGARNTCDGESGQFSSSHGQTFNCPAEVNEARNGVFVERYSLNEEQGGAGTWRGGKGVDLRYRVEHKQGWVTAAYTRSKVRPWAANGGELGTVNRLAIIREDGSVEDIESASALKLGFGDTVWIRTGVGGGYGDPKQRARAHVLDDLKNGYITQQEALTVYGLDASSTSSVS